MLIQDLAVNGIINLSIKDGFNHYPKPFLSATANDMRNYVGQIIQRYREDNHGTFRLESCVPTVVIGESLLIFVLFWVTVYNLKHPNNMIEVKMRYFHLEYDPLQVIHYKILRDNEDAQQLMDMIDNINFIEDENI